MGGKMVYNLRFVGCDGDLSSLVKRLRFSQQKPNIDSVCVVQKIRSFKN